MNQRRWTEADLPDLRGRTAVVTGANTGLGFQTARLLARHGAAVVLACRNLAKATAAAGQIRAAVPRAELRTVELDLAALDSVRAAASWLQAEYPHLDLLINNAGAVFPRHGRSADGFERTLATNHLGPFAFTGLVLDLLLAAPAARIVTVSSVGHRRGTIHLDDLNFDRGYRWQHAYFQSKLANLMFTFELQRRLTAAGAAAIAVAAHPGNARTDFGRDMPALARAVLSHRLRALTFWLLQPAEIAALPITRAAADPGVRGGEYYGPGGWQEWTGYPDLAQPIARAHDQDVQRQLWERSEQLTGVTYQLTPLGRTSTGRASSSRGTSPS
jgi:NAD(P)-dependent dehydrogenase (short-subunit alcohol dehydrogenase family)